MNLLILRHAKAEARAASGRDFDRKLSPRGREQCRSIAGEFDRARLPEPHRILVSPAARARETAALVLDAPAAERIEYHETIWEASPGDLAALLGDHREYDHTLMLVGHNPGLEGLVSWLLAGERPPTGLKTATVAWLRLPDAAPEPGAAELVDVIYPGTASTSEAT